MVVVNWIGLSGRQKHNLVGGKVVVEEVVGFLSLLEQLLRSLLCTSVQSSCRPYFLIILKVEAGGEVMICKPFSPDPPGVIFSRFVAWRVECTSTNNKVLAGSIFCGCCVSVGPHTSEYFLKREVRYGGRRRDDAATAGGIHTCIHD